MITTICHVTTCTPASYHKRISHAVPQAYPPCRHNPSLVHHVEPYNRVPHCHVSLVGLTKPCTPIQRFGTQHHMFQRPIITLKLSSVFFRFIFVCITLQVCVWPMYIVRWGMWRVRHCVPHVHHACHVSRAIVRRDTRMHRSRYISTHMHNAMCGSQMHESATLCICKLATSLLTWHMYPHSSVTRSTCIQHAYRMITCMQFNA